MKFTKGNIYKRSHLHDEFGGNRQGGISPSKSYPIIFIFTGNSGELYGYEDGWDVNGYFWYTGEGQIGDMRFIRGNKSLLNHKQNKKNVFLFEKTSESGFWRFVDELELDGFEYFTSKDREGDRRNIIKFRFISVNKKSEYFKELDINSNEYKYLKPNTTERRGLVTSRVGQGIYRQKIIEKWGGRCPITNCSILSILISSHIVPWSKSNDDERLDVDNGILLSPLYDSLFDRHLISFEDDGKLLLSSKLETQEIIDLGIDRNSVIPVSNGMRKYLKRHREVFYQND